MKNIMAVIAIFMQNGLLTVKVGFVAGIDYGPPTPKPMKYSGRTLRTDTLASAYWLYGRYGPAHSGIVLLVHTHTPLLVVLCSRKG